MLLAPRENGRANRSGLPVSFGVVDYALPRSKLARFLAYNFVSLYEGEYYAGFVQSSLTAMLREAGTEPEQELPVLIGAGRVTPSKQKSSRFLGV